MRRRLIAALSAAALLLGAGGAAAIPLGLSSDPPDIFSALLDVDFTGGVLTVSGTAFTFDDGMGGAQESITDGTFDLHACINAAGMAMEGELTIGGTLDGFGPILLTGTLAEFGFSQVGNGEPLEFLFDVTGGALADQYGPRAGVILTGSGYMGSFASDFSNDGFGLTDTAVPEPSILGLLVGTTGLFFAGHRRSS